MGLAWMLLLVWLVWYASRHVPGIGRLLENLPEALEAFLGRLTAPGPPMPR
jgi:hypothetical protein